jgi:glycosyl transferase family 25
LQIRVINLDRSPDRLAAFMSANAHLAAVSRFAAVDGRRLDLAALTRAGLIGEGLLHKDYYTIGAIGAAMSHLSLWEEAANSGTMLTIAEDDAIFHSRFEPHAAEVIERLPPDWDLILWGWNFDLFLCFEMLPGISTSLSQFEQERLRANAARFRDLAVSPRPFPLIWSFGIPCYTVTPKGGRALKSICLPLKPTIASFPPAGRTPLRAQLFRNVGIDSAMNNAYAKISAHVCFPPLVVTRNERATSTIQESP